ncbi:MAG: S9 family peptidase [Chitinophagaceae bacterium]|nr:S9 family peptidase [Chitinophagaceae bacterium]
MSTTAKRAFSIDDLAAIQMVGGAQLSPDGKTVVCVITRAEGEERKDFVVLIDVHSKQQTLIGKGSSLQWSPDGSAIAYMGEHNGQEGIVMHQINNRSEEFLTAVRTSGYFADHYADTNFRWSPDGKSIAYVSAEQEEKNEEEGVIVFTNLLYKTKGGRGRQHYSDESRNQVYLVSISDRKTKCLTRSGSASHSISWSPDSQKICFISNTTGHEDRNQWSDVFAVDITNGAIEKISSEKGSAFQPVWSPDGQFIAYLGITSELSTNDSPAEDTQLFIVPSDGGPAICLTRSLDRRVEQLSWDPTARFIYFTAGDSGNTFLYRVAIISGKIDPVIDQRGKVYEYSLSSDGKKIVYVHTDITGVPDIFIADTASRSVDMLTGAREALSGNSMLQPAESFLFQSTDGLKIQGWLMKPYAFNPGNKYPLILVVHGGPHNMFGNEFEDRMQLLSANGYGVLFINPRGSSGYGQEFSNGCVKAWGEGDYNDLMRGVDHVLENHPWTDGSRLGVTGQSYGGYMTNRIITKTNRFKAAVADGSISNLISFAGTSLYHSLIEAEFQGSTYDNYDLLWKCSPLKDVKNVSTPVLFLHGQTDNEVPFSQAEEMFIAIKKMGIETMLVQYKGEGHGWRPDLTLHNKTDLLERMLGWFEKYV